MRSTASVFGRTTIDDATADAGAMPFVLRSSLTSSAIFSVVGLFWSHTCGRRPASITAAAANPSSSPPSTAMAGLSSTVNADTTPSPAFSPDAPSESSETPRGSDPAPMNTVGSARLSAERLSIVVSGSLA